MKSLFITDTHITADAPPHRSPRSWVDFIFDRIEEALDKEEADSVLHGGDVFHSPNVPVEVVLRTRERIRSTMVPWSIVPGNHDRLNGRVSPCIIDLLVDKRAEVEVLQNGWIAESHEPSDLHISGASIDEKASYYSDIIILHQDIGPDGVRTHDGVAAATLFNEYPNAKYILCGHIHRRFALLHGDRYLLNPGCFAARTRDEIELGIDGGYVVLSPGTAPYMGSVGNLDDVISIDSQGTNSVSIDLEAILNHHSDLATLPVVAGDNILGALMDFAGFDYDFETIQAAVDFCKEVD